MDPERIYEESMIPRLTALEGTRIAEYPGTGRAVLEIELIEKRLTMNHVGGEVIEVLLEHELETRQSHLPELSLRELTEPYLLRPILYYNPFLNDILTYSNLDILAEDIAFYARGLFSSPHSSNYLSTLAWTGDGAYIFAQVEAASSVYVKRMSQQQLHDHDDYCPICLEAYSATAIELIQLPCCHVFHEHCILSWLKNTATCPICRRQHPRPLRTLLVEESHHMSHLLPPASTNTAYSLG